MTEFAWPDHVGIGGLALELTQSRPAHDISAAVRDWSWRLGGGCCPPGFPFDDVLGHYRRVGRLAANPAVTTQLRRVQRRLAHAGGQTAPLAQWLPSTLDQQDGDYDSYLVCDLLETVAVDDLGTDRLLLALLADLVGIEARVLPPGDPERRPRQRLRACVAALSALLELTGQPPWPGRGHDEEPQDVARRADALSAQLPGDITAAAGLSLLPTTVLHDELMFIRVLQVFETLYRQVFDRLSRARAAIRQGEVGAARASLAEANQRLGMSPALYRVITTMPKDAFAIIRGHTDGRSAVQSRWFRSIEYLGAPRESTPQLETLPPIKVEGPTVQDSFLAVAGRLSGPDVRELSQLLAALDASWRGMKRTHWGVARKIIGTVPGTGGTSGADYLRQAAELPLFPVTAVLPVGPDPVLTATGTSARGPR